MNKTILLFVLMSLGVSVLCSYYWAYLQSDAHKLWGGITGYYKLIWVIGGFLTAISFLYIGYFFICTPVVIPVPLIITYGIFFLSAGTWVFVTFNAIRHPSYFSNGLVVLNLFCTALTSCLIVYFLSSKLTQNRLLLLSSIVFLFQHIILDLIVWFLYFV